MGRAIRETFKIGRKLEIDKHGNLKCKHCGKLTAASNIPTPYLECWHCNNTITGDQASTIKELIKYIVKLKR
jgi:ribosomal protein L37AE/L43A